VFRTRIYEMIFLVARRDVKPVVGTIGNEHHPFRDGKVIVGDLKETPEARSVKLRGHFLDQVKRSADPPEHDVRFRVETHERIRVKQEIVTKLIVDILELGLKDAFRIGIQLSPIGINPKEHEIHELFFYFGSRGNALRIANKAEPALVTGILF